MPRPSPSLVLSIVAVVLATAGTSIAAIDYARNAGAVDGRSAVGAGSSQKRAAGKLVATAGGGPLEGKIPGRFLDLSAVVETKQTYAQASEVVDNAANTPVGIGGAPGVGVLTATCEDQNAAAGQEDPRVRIAFGNSSGQAVNLSHSIGNGRARVALVAAGTHVAFPVARSNVFRVYAQVGTAHYVFEGVVREDVVTGGAAACTVYGYGLAL